MTRLTAFLCAAAMFACSVPVHSVVVANDNSATYTQAPAGSDNFGFGNIAIVFNTYAGIPSSGVYLGDGWILTAFHNVTNQTIDGFAFGTITLGGLAYSADPATATRLVGPGPSNPLADLAMFRLTAIPGSVPSVNLAGTPTLFGTDVRMAGNGQDRDLTEKSLGSGLTGYDLVFTRTLRWGTNSVSNLNPVTGSSPFGSATGFLTTFNDINGDAHATGGDSGGGVFRKTGSNWELAGIMIGNTAPASGQPANTVAYGNGTFAADVSLYRSQIVSTMQNVPEPGSATLLLAGAGIFASRRRRSAER